MFKEAFLSGSDNKKYIKGVVKPWKRIIFTPERYVTPIDLKESIFSEKDVHNQTFRELWSSEPNDEYFLFNLIVNIFYRFHKQKKDSKLVVQTLSTQLTFDLGTDLGIKNLEMVNEQENYDFFEST